MDRADPDKDGTGGPAFAVGNDPARGKRGIPRHFP
jgi:hypothetical protein